MANRCVVGAQWGDEGKGKVVDVLSEHADVVARFSGGANAGHTVRIGGQTFALHLVPTGVLRAQVTGVIGNGVVLDLPQLFREIDELGARGISVERRMKISTAAHVVMPYHKVLEAVNEQRRGCGAIGTTMRGIGPAYADKVARVGVRTACLLDPPELRRRVELNVEDINRRTDGALARAGSTVDLIVQETLRFAERLAPLLCDTSLVLHEAWKQGQTILLEGAQGVLLDIDFGTYPFTTSSNNTSGGAFTGLGVSPRLVDEFAGVSKAYITRVGNGPFPTEVTGEPGDRLRDTGGEFGTTTGRPRRCGWLDLVALRYAARVNGLDWLALTKLDVLDGLDEVPVCTAYDYGGRTIEHMPADLSSLGCCRPIFLNFHGWPDGSTRGKTSFRDLPAAAQNYVRFIEEFTGTKVGMISTGAERDKTILRF